MATYGGDTTMYVGMEFFALVVYDYIFIMKATTPPVAPVTPYVAHVAPGAIAVNNSLITNPYKEEGDLFGAGFQQIEEIEIAKGMNDVNTVCYPKCLNNTNCAGFGYSIADRYDGRTNGNCWFMKAPIQHTRLDIKTPGVGGVWIKKY